MCLARDVSFYKCPNSYDKIVPGFSGRPPWAVNWRKDKLSKQDVNYITALAVACV